MDETVELPREWRRCREDRNEGDTTQKKKISFAECTFRISPDPEGLGKLLSNKIIVTDYRHSSFNIPSP